MLEFLESIGFDPKSWLSFMLTIVIVVFTYNTARAILDRQIKGKTDKALIRSLILSSLALAGVIIIIISIPMSESLRGQVTNLIGIILAAALSLSSTTFLGNAMAGIMVKTVGSFKPGDFVRVGDIFGRVTERGLFHTEIQTVDRDLITLPNLFLANNPVKVIRKSGTFVEAKCSLGYDVSRVKVERCLLDAAKKAGLVDAFVLIEELGDFSIVYSIHGMLENVENILFSKSKLQAMMLDTLHLADIEIVSPNFVNQRQVNDTLFIPKNEDLSLKHKLDSETAKAENIIFDKAKEASFIQERRDKLAEMENKITEINKQIKETTDVDKKEELKKSLENWTKNRDNLLEAIDNKLEQINKEQ